MKIFQYHKVDRGYYEDAYQSWRRTGGSFLDHLLDKQVGFRITQREMTRAGIVYQLDIRSSLLLPQQVRCYLPLPIAKLLRGGLWVTKLDPWLLQQDIIRRINAFNPDVVFFSMGSSVWESTLQKLKESGRHLTLFCDLPAKTMMERDRRNLPYFDIIFEVANLSKGLRTAGATHRIEYVPIGFDPMVHRPLALTQAEREQYGSDVCFIGGLGTRYHSERREWVEYAIEQGVNMKIWGGYREHFVGSPILNHWHGQIWGDEQVKALCATKIGINFHVNHEPGELDKGINSRAFELAGCGVFQLLRRVPSVNEFFEEGKEIVCFDTREEMLDKIKYYLKHETERTKIASASRRRALRDHVWSKRFDSMFAGMRQAFDLA